MSGIKNPPVFFNQHELSLRWSISGRTLERWRYERSGPNYVRIGGRVLYRISEIEEYERQGDEFLS
jgi:hypothetical protein|tara:strand:+ start:82 stop:279 length:198 start_codon:yes stop_codon:yes gene_type:complete